MQAEQGRAVDLVNIVPLAVSTPVLQSGLVAAPVVGMELAESSPLGPGETLRQIGTAGTEDEKGR